MSLPVPLRVRLKTAAADRHVTRDLRGLSFRSTAPGGFASATFELTRALDVEAPEIQPLGRVFVYDGRNGSTVWEGWLEDPGRGAGEDGQVWKISALGHSSRANDQKIPWIYYDRSLERWTRTPGADVQVDSRVEPDANDEPSVRLSIAGGTSITGGNYFGMTYTGLSDTGQKVARFGGSWQAFGPEPAGVDYFARMNAFADRLSSSASDTNLNSQFAAGTTAFGPYVVGTHITAGRTALTCFIGVGGGGHLAPAGMHMRILQWYVLGTRYDRNGSEILTSSAYNAAAPAILQAHQVVEDLLGRLLPTFDGPNARIDTNTYNIDTLVYPNGATAAQILEDLMRLEPAYFWTVWESATWGTTGRARFEWKPWPSTIRYEASVVDGYDAPSSATDLFDSVQIRWVDEVGRSRQRVRTQAVPALAAAGISRRELLDLGDSIGSDANAVQAGDGFLADHRQLSAGGTLTVRRPILDMQAGRMVMPWEIRPGHLIRVRGLAARADSLNASARDGVTVFRVIATSFDAASASASLELDTYPRTIAQALARLAKAQRRPVR